MEQLILIGFDQRKVVWLFGSGTKSSKRLQSISLINQDSQNSIEKKYNWDMKP